MLRASAKSKTFGEADSPDRTRLAPRPGCRLASANEDALSGGAGGARTCPDAARHAARRGTRRPREGEPARAATRAPPTAHAKPTILERRQ